MLDENLFEAAKDFKLGLEVQLQQNNDPKDAARTAVE